MIVINLFGQPSAGKSTTASGLFFEMKTRGINCELVTEYAKDMVWRGMPARAFDDQLYITAKQHSKLHRVADKVDYVITDSPLFLSMAYLPENYFPSFAPFVVELFKSFNNVNFFLNRTKPYNPIGRNQTEAESDEVGLKIKTLLVDYSIDFEEIKGDVLAPKEIIHKLGL